MTFTLAEPETGYLAASIDDVMRHTKEWSNREWHEQLVLCCAEDVLQLYAGLRAYNPYIYNGIERNMEAGQVYDRALFAIRSHLNELMNPRNWADKWWLQ